MTRIMVYNRYASSTNYPSVNLAVFHKKLHTSGVIYSCTTCGETQNRNATYSRFCAASKKHTAHIHHDRAVYLVLYKKSNPFSSNLQNVKKFALYAKHNLLN